MKSIIVLALMSLVSSACGRGCNKMFLDECGGSLPKPFSTKPAVELLTIAANAQLMTPDVLAMKLFAIPPVSLINRTCAVYAGLRGCDQPMRRMCSAVNVRNYQDFRASYNDLCHFLGRMKYFNNYQCLTNSTQLQSKVVECLDTYRTDTAQIMDGNFTALQNSYTLCSAREKLKLCSLQAVDAVCGQYSREFWFNHNFPHDTNQESQKVCKQDAERMFALNQSAWLVCEDGSNIVPRSFICDQDQDCFNNQDEKGCGDSSIGKRMSTSAIMGIVVAIILFIVILICIIKCRREMNFKKDYLPAETNEKGIEVEEVA